MEHFSAKGLRRKLCKGDLRLGIELDVKARVFQRNPDLCRLDRGLVRRNQLAVLKLKSGEWFVPFLERVKLR